MRHEIEHLSVAISHPQPHRTSMSHSASGTKEFSSENCFFTLRPEKQNRWCWCWEPHQERDEGCERHLSGTLNPGAQLLLLSRYLGLGQESVLQVSASEDIRLQSEAVSCVKEIRTHEKLSWRPEKVWLMAYRKGIIINLSFCISNVFSVPSHGRKSLFLCLDRFRVWISEWFILCV